MREAAAYERPIWSVCALTHGITNLPGVRALHLHRRYQQLVHAIAVHADHYAHNRDTDLNSGQSGPVEWPNDSAALAPRRPSSAHCCSRVLREATTDISDIAKTPFRTISRKRISSSMGSGGNEVVRPPHTLAALGACVSAYARPRQCLFARTEKGCEGVFAASIFRSRIHYSALPHKQIAGADL
jgi:hypothetical protein